MCWLAISKHRLDKLNNCKFKVLNDNLMNAVSIWAFDANIEALNYAFMYASSNITTELWEHWLFGINYCESAFRP